MLILVKILVVNLGNFAEVWVMFLEVLVDLVGLLRVG